MLGLIGLSINGFASTEALFKLGNQAYQKGAYEQAIEYYDKACKYGSEEGCKMAKKLQEQAK